MVVSLSTLRLNELFLQKNDKIEKFLKPRVSLLNNAIND